MTHYSNETHQRNFNENSAIIASDQQNLTITKIANFIQMKNIFINQFWQSNRNYASLQDIQKFCETCGLKLGVHDQISLKNQLFLERQVISIYQFCDLIQHWKKKGTDMIGQFLKQRSQHLVQNLNTKIKNQRIKSSTGKLTRPLSVNSTMQAKMSRQYSLSKQQIKQYKPNNSRKYLQQNRIKILQKQQQLADTIQKTKNQHEYSMLMKMNELNEYLHKNKSMKTYRAYKNAEGIIKVRIFQLEKFKKQLSIQQFQSQYKVHKKSTKQNKQWQRLKSTKVLNLSSNTQELLNKAFQSTNSATKVQKKQQRQQQLKNLLVNTVNLTRLLQEQIKIFKMKGIYGCQNI